MKPAPVSPVMSRLSQYIASARRKLLPPPALEATRHHVLDTLAAMVSGAKLKPGKTAIAYVKSLGGRPEATVVGSRVVTSAVTAALARLNAKPGTPRSVLRRAAGFRAFNLHA